MDKSIPFGQSAHKISIYFQSSWKPPSIKAQRVIREVHIKQEFVWGYFDGASQGTPGNCGARALLFLSSDNYFHWKLCAGLGSNNRAELYALWMLLNIQ
jgi:hypothetical protein